MNPALDVEFAGFMSSAARQQAKPQAFSQIGLERSNGLPSVLLEQRFQLAVS